MLTSSQVLVIVGMVTLGTQITRFLPFVAFPAERGMRPLVVYLGQVLPYAMIGFLVVYCLKGVDVRVAPHGLPEAVAIGVIAVLQVWKKNSLLSIGAGTVLYMLLVQGILK